MMSQVSYVCKVSGLLTTSNYGSGTAVHMFLLQNGNVIEHMFGNYNGEGGVFKNNFDDDEESSYSWMTSAADVAALVESDDRSNGIAVIHAHHYRGIPPTTRSDFVNIVDLDGAYEYLNVKVPFHQVMDDNGNLVIQM